MATQTAAQAAWQRCLLVEDAHEEVPWSRAQMAELSTAWAQAARVEADAWLSRGTVRWAEEAAAEAMAEAGELLGRC